MEEVKAKAEEKLERARKADYLTSVKQREFRTPRQRLKLDDQRKAYYAIEESK